MAEKEFEDDDPMELVGMVIDGDEDTMELMGRTFVDEFLRMGWPPEAILGLFQDPFYRSPHSIYEQKGERYVVDMIESVRSEQAVR